MRHVRKDGRVLVLKDNKLAYEHRVLMEEHLDRPLSPTEVVHHKNGDPSDNRLENLEILSQRAHALLHLSKPHAELICPMCNTVFTRKPSQVRWAKKSGQRAIYCNRKCAGKAPKRRSRKEVRGHHYQTGCRCDDCRRLATERQRRYRAKKKHGE